MCTTGRNKSVGVICGTVLIVIIIGTICCCQNRRIAKNLRKLEGDAIKAQKTAEQMKIAGQVGALLGMRQGNEGEELSTILKKNSKSPKKSSSPSK